MRETDASKEVRADLKQFIIDHPGVNVERLMIRFDWKKDWKRCDALSPLKYGYGINGNECFLFVSRDKRSHYYYEMGYALANKIAKNVGLEDSIVETELTKELERERYESLLSNIRLSKMMKGPETV